MSDGVLDVYERRIIPYWRGRTLRDRIFESCPGSGTTAYEAGIFTEFMEQRAPGHTVLDDKIYRKGMLDFKADIAAAIGGAGFRCATRRRWTSASSSHGHGHRRATR